MGRGAGTKAGQGRVKEGRRSTINRARVVDAIRYFYSVRVIIFVDREWCLRAPDSSVCKIRLL